MPLPPVVIEVAAPDATPENLESMLAACNRAMVGSHCVLAGDTPETANSSIAIVTWERDHARVELGMRRDQGNQWRSRELVFQVSDQPLERWRTVGFTIGTLAGGEAGAAPEHGAAPEQSAARAASGAPPPAAAATQKQTSAKGSASRATATESLEPVDHAGASEPPPKLDPVRGFIDAGLESGPGMDFGAWRLGGLVRGALVLPGSGVFVGASGGYAERSTDDFGLHVRYFDAGAGVGYMFGTDARFALALSVEAVAERLVLDVTDATGASDSGNRWLGGARAGADLAWMATPALGVFAGGDAAWLGAATDVRVRAENVAVVPAYRWTVKFGLRLCFR